MLKLFPKALIILLLLVFALLPSNAVLAETFKDNLGWAVHGSIFYFAANNGVDSDPAPIIPSAGFSLAWQLIDYLKLEFTQDIYFTNYEWESNLGYPMACNIENRAAFVLGFLTGVQATGYFPLDKISLRVYGGPAVDFRVVTTAFGLNHPADYIGDIETNVELQTEAIKNYFWQSGRWFMPVAGLGFDFPINEKFLLGFDLRAWFPVYKIWTDDNAPAIDGWRFGAGFRIAKR